jgi:two-component system sensor histidine kinase/response regulator
MQSSQDTILIIDDSEAQLQLNSYYLNELECNILTAKSGREGIEVARLEKPDLILLDVNMPVIDGYETCRVLKDDHELSSIPVIFISALNEIHNIIKGFEAGGVDYIIKPLKKEELIVRIKTHLTIKHLQEHLLGTIEEKRLLINILSHDISNHLTVIQGSGEIALGRSIHYKDRELENAIQSVIDAGVHINDIIKNIRIMESIETGKAKLRLEPVEVREIIKYILESYRQQLDEKKIQFICDPAPEFLNMKVIADRVSVTNSVFGNIMSNAIKFSHAGSIIALSVKEIGDTINITLKDNGIGIPSHILNNIFNPAYPTTRSGTSGEKGIGFGMPIVQKCMKSYDGAIRITSSTFGESARNHGTVINLTFRKG